MPALATAALFSGLPPARFLNTPDACSLTAGAALLSTARTGTTAPASRAAALFSALLEVRLCNARVACLCTPSVSAVSSATSGTIAPACPRAAFVLPSLSMLLGVIFAIALAMASCLSAAPSSSSLTARGSTEKSRRSSAATTDTCSSVTGAGAEDDAEAAGAVLSLGEALLTAAARGLLGSGLPSNSSSSSPDERTVSDSFALGFSS
mmetsp:Transcript_61241/g.112010  ORF Transcript_61241/g.112010 Transcript_61241/m.112010 type:complete len:208 (-) Transcript_61241:33-656(-)